MEGVVVVFVYQYELVDRVAKFRGKVKKSHGRDAGCLCLRTDEFGRGTGRICCGISVEGGKIVRSEDTGARVCMWSSTA